jgi:hypothetical protein
VGAPQRVCAENVVTRSAATRLPRDAAAMIDNQKQAVRRQSSGRRSTRESAKAIVTPSRPDVITRVAEQWPRSPSRRRLLFGESAS